MKKVLCVAVVMVMFSLTAIAEDAVQPGVWTQDLSAAKAVALAQEIPILLNFMGSDWCGYCKMMDKDVFSLPAWSEYAAGKLMLVALDFPRDKSLVPESYVQRNNELRKQFTVPGFPTYVLLDADGETELGRLAAGRGKTPESFAGEVDQLIRFSKAWIAMYLDTLSPENRTAYEAVLHGLDHTRKEIEANKEHRAQLDQQIAALHEAADELKEKTAELRAAHAGPAQLAEYNNLKIRLASARSELNDWLKTAPKPTTESRAEHRAMVEAIQDLETKLATF